MNKSNKHLSILMLLAKSTILKIILVLIFMSVAEIILYMYSSGSFGGKISILFEDTIQRSKINFIFAICSIIITFILIGFGCKSDTKERYVLMRLRISETWIFIWHAIYSILIYIILWSVQIFLIYLFGKIFTSNAVSEVYNNQAIFLAYYRSEFIHMIMPLGEVTFWIRNFIIIISLGFCSARYSHGHRREDKTQEIFFGLCSCLILLRGDMGGFGKALLLSLIMITLLIIAVYRAIFKWKKEELKNEIINS